VVTTLDAPVPGTKLAIRGDEGSSEAALSEGSEQ
jgi:hypothetical protein